MATTKRAPKADLAKRVDRRKTTSTRITPETRAQLEAASAHSGRSLAQEIEFRLEQSFKTEEQARDIAAQTAGAIYGSFGSFPTFQAMRLLAEAISLTENRTGKSWETDPNTFEAVRRTCGHIFQVFRPHADSAARSGLFELGTAVTEAEHLGAEVAKKVVSDWVERLSLVEALRGAGHLEEAAKEE